MKFVLESGNELRIHGYDKGRISLTGVHSTQRHPGCHYDMETGLTHFPFSLLLSARGELAPWPVQNPAELQPSQLEQAMALQPEVLLIGMGARLVFPDDDCLRVLQQHHIGYEIMDTAAACRTYNVLAAEGREVVAGLMCI